MSASIAPTPEEMAIAAGTTLREVARNWPNYRPRMTEKQMKNRIAKVRRAVRYGRIHAMPAARLARLLKCSPMVFLYGAPHYYRDLAGRTGANGNCPAAAEAGHLRRCDRPTLLLAGGDKG